MGAMIYQVNTTTVRDTSNNVSRTVVVLVVDDEKALLALVQDVLEDEGFEVLTASEGAEALELAQKTCPDLIITDLMMPKMTGRMLCKKLDSLPTTSAIPIILMTAVYDAEADDHFDAVVAKPFHLDDFLDCVHRFADTASTNP